MVEPIKLFFCTLNIRRSVEGNESELLDRIYVRLGITRLVGWLWPECRACCATGRHMKTGLGCDECTTYFCRVSRFGSQYQKFLAELKQEKLAAQKSV